MQIPHRDYAGAIPAPWTICHLSNHFATSEWWFYGLLRKDPPMMRRLAVAVLQAVVTVIGTANLDAAVVDIVDDDDGMAVECVEYRWSAARREPSHHVVAEVQPPIAWVVRRPDGPTAAAAIQHISAHIALIDLADKAGPAIASPSVSLLLDRALDHCRAHGMLKVIIESTPAHTPAVQAHANSRGYQLTRTQHAATTDQSEFYTDLYWHADEG